MADHIAMIVTRFAPSPNGLLHLGHAFSAIVAHDLAAEKGGRFLLRIEDIDGERSRPELADAFRADLEWLGLQWEEVPVQSQRIDTYRAAFERLKDMGLLYPCICTRADIAACKPQIGPMGSIYPGTCKGRAVERAVDEGAGAVWRLDADKAMAQAGPLHWQDAIAGQEQVDMRWLGDVVLWRKDNPASYHLAATLDDAADGVTLVTRGRDLFHASHVHRLLQALLELPVPAWHHHELLMDQQSIKLAKRRGSPSLADLRQAGEDGRVLADRLRQRIFPSGISLGRP